VRICSIPATIVSQTATDLVVTVPAGAAGDCVVEVDSLTGTYIHATSLHVP